MKENLQATLTWCIFQNREILLSIFDAGTAECRFCNFAFAFPLFFLLLAEILKMLYIFWNLLIRKAKINLRGKHFCRPCGFTLELLKC